MKCISKIAGVMILLSALPVAAQSMGARGHGPQLTDEQRSCLEGVLGAPNSGARPSFEQMQSAMQQCGIQPPSRGAGAPHRGFQNSGSPFQGDDSTAAQ